MIKLLLLFHRSDDNRHKLIIPKIEKLIKVKCNYANLIKNIQFVSIDKTI